MLVARAGMGIAQTADLENDLHLLGRLGTFLSAKDSRVFASRHYRPLQRDEKYGTCAESRVCDSQWFPTPACPTLPVLRELCGSPPAPATQALQHPEISIPCSCCQRGGPGSPWPAVRVWGLGATSPSHALWHS